MMNNQLGHLRRSWKVLLAEVNLLRVRKVDGTVHPIPLTKINLNNLNRLKTGVLLQSQALKNLN